MCEGWESNRNDVLSQRLPGDTWGGEGGQGAARLNSLANPTLLPPLPSSLLHSLR